MLTLRGKQSVERAFELIKRFAKAFGLKLNQEMKHVLAKVDKSHFVNLRKSRLQF